MNKEIYADRKILLGCPTISHNFETRDVDKFYFVGNNEYISNSEEKDTTM